jgi:lipopolysaccharide transport system ATP-binding protein
MTRAEVDKKIDAIIDFAGLRHVIDQPFKTYSSGMMARLTFATAISVDPDIFIIDEALAAGDAFFTLRCMRRIREICKSGATVFFVSHATSTVAALCTKAMLMENGRIVRMGKAREVVQHYEEMIHESIRREMKTDIAPVLEACGHVQITVERIVQITAVRLLGPHGPSELFSMGRPLRIEVDYVSTRETDEPLAIAVAFTDAHHGTTVCQFGTVNAIHNSEFLAYGRRPYDRPAGRQGRFVVEIDSLPLCANDYLLSLGLMFARPGNCEFLDYKGYVTQFRVVATAFSPPGVFVPPARYSHEVLEEFQCRAA